MNKNVLLVILDGWGLTQQPDVSAIAKAQTPYIDNLMACYPNAKLRTHGAYVGLPDGQMGNSEVGHMNIGAGRVVYQDLAKINNAIKTNTFSQQEALQRAFSYAKEQQKPLHLIGLVSDGGVHSHYNHLKALLQAAKEAQLSNVFVHAFTDGRDVDPQSGITHITQLQTDLAQTTARLASVTGRYYAMDRDQRWERVKKAYDALIHGKGILTENPLEAIQASYDKQVTDEFLEPHIITQNGLPIATIKDNDAVVFFNFRTDRGRQLTQVLTQQDMPAYNMVTRPLHFVTLTQYDENFKNIHIAFKKENLNNTLGEVLAKHNKTQIRIAETEKYPHVTFFFNGGRELPFPNERRILCPSPKVATYDLKPEMSAFEIKDKIIPELEAKTANFICLNFANPDMVGHTGNFEAAIKACEAVDTCTKAVVDTAKNNAYSILIIADHGNSETMQNPDGSPHTAHTTNLVPLIWVEENALPIQDGALADIAPTILKIMGIMPPKAMTGKALF